MARADDLVVVAEINQRGFITGQFVLVQSHIRTYNHDVSGSGKPGCGTVDGNHAGAILCADGVGSEALTIVDVVNMDLLVFSNPRTFEQQTVNGARALVFEFGVSHSTSV